MDESVFGAGFDLQDYIHKRSLDIQDLRERALYRQVTDTLMVNLFQYLGDEQKKLEQRILSEIQSRESEFTIHITSGPPCPTAWARTSQSRLTGCSCAKTPRKR